VPITIVDSGTDPTHPDFAGRPNTTYLNEQTTVGREEYHGTMVASLAAAPENGTDLVGVYPTAALQLFDASPNGQILDFAAISGIELASAHCPGVINLSFGSVIPDPQLHDAILQAARQRLSRRRGRRQLRPRRQPRGVSRLLATRLHRRSNGRERRGDGVLEHLPRERHRRPGHQHDRGRPDDT